MPVFVVTGARTGIGLEYIRQLGNEPSNTVVALVRDLKADITALKAIVFSSNASVHISECDISSETSLSSLVPQLVSELGPGFKIDVLINNAAILHSRQETSLNLTADTLISHFSTNVVGPAKVLQILLPRLAPGAVVANISSGIGSLTMLSEGRIAAETTPYSISKTALNMLTVHQAKQLEGKVTIVCVDPGHVKTVMGGANAVLEISDSAKGVLALLARLKLEDNGKFFLYNGTELPW
jgi:NAD(P)-dependent dehydrogenase (short-subunit alcohol dehydrogenase family)